MKKKFVFICLLLGLISNVYATTTGTTRINFSNESSKLLTVKVQTYHYETGYKELGGFTVPARSSKGSQDINHPDRLGYIIITFQLANGGVCQDTVAVNPANYIRFINAQLNIPARATSCKVDYLNLKDVTQDVRN